MSSERSLDTHINPPAWTITTFSVLFLIQTVCERKSSNGKFFSVSFFSCTASNSLILKN